MRHSSARLGSQLTILRKRINDTFTAPVAKGILKKKIDWNVAHSFSLAIPFSQALFLSSFSLIIGIQKKIHLRRLDMGFPFYPNSYNGSRLRLIRENLRKLNKQKNWFGRNHVLECSGRGRPPEWGSTGGPLVAWSIMPPSSRSGRSLPSSSSNKIKRDIEKKFRNWVLIIEKSKKIHFFVIPPP